MELFFFSWEKKIVWKILVRKNDVKKSRLLNLMISTE
jgi:hypothetical protein